MSKNKKLIECLDEYKSLCNDANLLLILTKQNIKINVALNLASFCHLIGFHKIFLYKDMSNSCIIELIEKKEITFDTIFDKLKIMRLKKIFNKKENRDYKDNLLDDVNHVKLKIKTLKDININNINFLFDSIITDENIARSMHEYLKPNFILFYKNGPYYHSFALNKNEQKYKNNLKDFYYIKSCISWKIKKCCKKNRNNHCCKKKKTFDKFINNISEIQKINTKI